MPAAPEAPELSADDVKEHIVRNSISNYIFLVIRVGLGAVLFRLIYQELNAEDFGFWTLLWSMLGYGLLLDFGFGFTAQKRVAELCVHKDWDCLSRVLSTILYTYLAIAAFIIVFGYIAAPYLIGALRQVSPENVERYTAILRVFIVGLGLALPLGTFPEILRGQHRISLVNNVLLACYLGSFLLVLVAISKNWGLLSLFVISFGGTLLADTICGFFAFARMPQVRIAPGLFSRGMIRETTRFSIYAYIGTLTTVILTRTDHLIISTGLAVAALTVYQAGAKVSELFSNFSLQMADTLSPAAAHLHAQGDRRQLRNLLMKATRFTALIATPLYLLCIFFLPELLRLLTGENLATTQPEAYWVGQVLLLWTYSSVISQSVTRRVFMMCGHEKKLTWLGLAEAGMNLVLSIILMAMFKNVVSVAIGSLIATVIFGWFFMWPWAAKEAEIGSWVLAREVLTPAWIASLPLLAIIAVLRLTPAFANPESTLSFLLEGSIAGLVAAVSIWRFALDHHERNRFGGMFLARFRRQAV